VLLLADVFEAFRDMCMHQYELDPDHYITLLGMCIDGDVIEAVKKDNKVELIHTDPDKYTFLNVEFVVVCRWFSTDTRRPTTRKLRATIPASRIA
jgi:hypothetical protein